MSDASNLPSESDLVETYDIHVGSGYAIRDRFETTVARQAMDRIKAAARREGQAEAWDEAVASAYLHEDKYRISIEHDPNPYRGGADQ